MVQKGLEMNKKFTYKGEKYVPVQRVGKFYAADNENGGGASGVNFTAVFHESGDLVAGPFNSGVSLDRYNGHVVARTTNSIGEYDLEVGR